MSGADILSKWIDLTRNCSKKTGATTFDAKINVSAKSDLRGSRACRASRPAGGWMPGPRTGVRYRARASCAALCCHTMAPLALSGDGGRRLLGLACLALGAPLPGQARDLVAVGRSGSPAELETRARALLDGFRLPRRLVQVQHGNRSDVGDVLAATLQQSGIADLDIEQNRIEALAAEAPQRVSQADDRYDLRRRHVVDQRAYQPRELAGFLPEQQKAVQFPLTQLTRCKSLATLEFFADEAQSQRCLSLLAIWSA
jgi:hypothetical protein